MNTAEVQRLFTGDLSITVTLARNLAAVIGASATFWLTRDAQYLEDRARVAADRWSQQLPISQMAAFGWVDKPNTWQERIAISLDFFGVGDVDAWETRYKRRVASTHYRRSATFKLEAPATTVWFRAAERVVDSRGEIPKFDREGLSRSLATIRGLTRERDPEKFVPRLISLCGEQGVHVAVIRAPSGCPASGACRMYAGRPLIQLSGRHLTDDHFWFSFFHEAVHVIKHPLEEGFIDVPEVEEDDTYEQEANNLARQYLLGPDGSRLLQTPNPRWSHRDIIREAVALDVAPGVLVGQLQHADIVSMGHFNRLKRRYRWNRDQLLAAEQ